MFNVNRFLEIALTNTNKIASRRVSEKHFTDINELTLWNEFLVSTSLYEDLTLHQRAKVVQLGKHEHRPMCECCGVKPVGIAQNTLSTCCSRECEKKLGIKKVHKPKTGKKYNETGKRRESIEARVLSKTTFDTTEELIEAIRVMVEEEHIPHNIIAEKLNIGIDSVRRYVKENGIRVDLGQSIRNGVMNKYGVENVMSVSEIHERQIEELRKVYDERGEEIVQKQQQTTFEKTGYYHNSQNPVSQEKRKQTFLNNYGYEHYTKVPGASEEQYQRVLESNGGTHPMNESGFHKRSKGEMDVENEIRTRFPWVELVLNGRSQLSPTNFEIDIFLPQYNVGVEFSGIYHHSELFKSKTDHMMKALLARNNGIRLLNIWSSEWKYRREQVMNMIGSVVGFGEQLYARKCSVMEISKDVATNFINDYHIQQILPQHISKSVGIFHNEILVGVMSFGKHHRGGSTSVLNRMCFKTGYRVVGGASKMFHNAVKLFDIQECVTWSDNRFSLGGVYDTLGFIRDDSISPRNLCIYWGPTPTQSGGKRVGKIYKTPKPTFEDRVLKLVLDVEVGVSDPDYGYIHKNHSGVTPKQSCTKTKLKASPGQTELERATELGYVRIWDAGKITWIWKK